MRTSITLKEILNFLGPTQVWIKAPREKDFNCSYISTTDYFLTEPEEEIKDLLHREVKSIEKADSKESKDDMLSHNFMIILTIPEQVSNMKKEENVIEQLYGRNPF